MTIEGQLAESLPDLSAELARFHAMLADLGRHLEVSAEEHRQLFTDSGYVDVQLAEQTTKDWICAIGRKASTTTACADF